MYMGTNSVLVHLPANLIAEIDEMVGPGMHDDYLIQLVQRDLEMHRQNQALEAALGAWKSEDHPELANGTDAFIRELRSYNPSPLGSFEATPKG